MKWPIAGLLGRIEERLPSPQGVCPHAYLECVRSYFVDLLSAQSLIN